MLLFFLQGETHLELLTLQDLGLSYWREQPCRVRRGATSVFDGRVDKGVLSLELFLLYDYCVLPGGLRPPTRTLKNTAEICLCDPDTCPLNSSLSWRKTSQPRPDENKHIFPRFFCGKDELKPKLIYLKNLGKKQNRFFKSHSFSPIGMLLAGVLQRKLLLKWKTLEETHVMWDFNSLELGKVKESGPYTLGLFSFITKNVYAIDFNHFIRNPLHLLDTVNTNWLKLIFRRYTIILYKTHSWGKTKMQKRKKNWLVHFFILYISAPLFQQ